MDPENGISHDSLPLTENGENTNLEHKVCELTMFRITDLYPSKPLFTRPRLQEAISELKRITPTGGGDYTLKNIENKFLTIGIYLELASRDDENKWRLGITFHPYTYVPKELLNKFKERRVGCEYTQTLPFSISAIGFREHECWNPSTSEIEKEMKQWAKYWAVSSYRTKLLASLSQNASALQKVDKILCFALGELSRYSQFGTELARSYIQHLAAATIRDALSEICGCKVEIYAQDPAYCSTCVEILKSRLNINVVPDPDAFLLIDDRTFVMTVAPDVPIEQIATDIAYEEGGPAALLCNTILTPEEEYTLDVNSTVCGMGNGSTNPSSWRVIEYRDRCVVCELDGEEAAFGRTALYVKN